jgi:hypothetical protein
MSLKKMIAKKTAKKVAKKIVKKKKPNRMFSSATGAGRGKFERGGPPAPKIEKAKDTPFGRDLDVKVVVGREGKSEKAGTINIGDDVVGFSNFLKMQQSKSGLNRAKYKEKLNQITRSKSATKTQKEKAQSKINAMEAADEKATAKMGRGRRGKSTKTIAKSDDPFFKALDMAKKTGELGEDYDKLLPNQKKQIVQAAKAFQKSDFRRDVEAKISAPKNAPISTGTPVARKMSQGGLKMPSADQVGLKKLPTAVRNKMGYMYGGGMTKKPKMGNTDYRKGGMVMIVLDMMKKKKGRK